MILLFITTRQAFHYDRLRTFIAFNPRIACLDVGAAEDTSEMEILVCL